jgi:hypothetical protein
VAFPIDDPLNMTEQQPSPVGKSRFIIGATLFVGGFLSPLLIPLVINSDLSGEWKTFLSTGLVAGLPEVGMVAAVAVLGKQGFAELKNKIYSLLKKHTEQSGVSQGRYRLGLVMFFIPLLFAWVGPYARHFFPGLGSVPISLDLILDLVFAASFLVLGAGFWEKIRNLFVHDPVPASKH